MYTIHRPQPGSYQILAHFYSTDANRTTSRTRVLLNLVCSAAFRRSHRTTSHTRVLLNLVCSAAFRRSHRTTSHTRVLLNLYDAPGVKPQRRAILLENRQDKQPIGSIEWPPKPAAR